MSDSPMEDNPPEANLNDTISESPNEKSDIWLDLQDNYDEIARLDEAALKSLNVLNDKETGHRSDVRSLFDVLNKCRTAPGKRLLEQWLKHPLVQLDRLIVRQDLVEFFVQNDSVRFAISTEHLASLPDLKRLSTKLAACSASLLECCRILQVILSLAPLVILLQKHSQPNKQDTGDHGNDLQARIHRCYTVPLRRLKRQFDPFIELMQMAIDQDSLAAGDPLISHNVAAGLQTLHQQLSAIREKAEKEQRSMAKRIDAEPDKELRLECDPEIGFQLRVPLRLEHRVRSISGLKMLGTKKDGIRFRHSDLANLSDQYLELRTEYEQEQKHLVDDLKVTLSTYSEPLLQLAGLLAHLDVIVGLANAAQSPDGGVSPYVRPQLLPMQDGILVMKQVRHPVLERRAGVYYMPNDIDLNRDQRRFVILTGPNMGGKSTYMRSIGCCMILAQIGSFVPANHAQVSLVDGFYTRVGASDAQCMGDSTFLTEMKDTSFVLGNATAHSLVIIDELGRGTSTFDGLGLAYSISQELIEKNQCFCMFATHYHELTTLAEKFPVVVNLKVTFSEHKNEGTVRMLYQVQEGLCDQRFGLHVAQMVSFPPEVINDAQKQMKELEHALGNQHQNLDTQDEKLQQILKQLGSSESIDQMSDDMIIEKANQLKSQLKVFF